VRLLAVALFLFIGWLTLPKLAPRMHRLFTQREARVEIARKNSGRPSPSPDEAVRSADVLLIGGAAIGGGVVLLSLGYLVLRRGTTAEGLKSGDFSRREPDGLRSGDLSDDAQAKRDLSG
jgi:hypothetical protein